MSVREYKTQIFGKGKTMAKENFWLRMLVMVLVFGMTVVGCDFETEEEKEEKRIQEYSGTVNGTWHLVDSGYNRTGSTININGSGGTLTAIGNDDIFKVYSGSSYGGPINIGDAVLRNINFKGEWDGFYGKSGTMYWTCEFIIPWDAVSGYYNNLGWHNTYISYNTKNDYIFIYVMGDPSFGQGYRFKK